MVVYFETSALVKLIVDEVGSDLAREVWNSADALACVSLGYVEASAALNSARRAGRLKKRQLAAATTSLERLWNSCELVAIDDWLIDQAARLCYQFPLAGYDATHLAASRRLAGVHMITWDKRLADAALTLGISTIGAV